MHRARTVRCTTGLALLALAVPWTASAAVPDGPLTNLAHLDYLGADVAPPAQADHTTFRLADEPEVGVLWTYAEPTANNGPYRRVGGGTYDGPTNTWGQGAYNADDMARAAVVYVRHFRLTGEESSRVKAYDLLRGLTYLQTAEGPNAGNVVLWMQPDGTLNPSADPVELPDPSDSGESYWLARTVWALGEGYGIFRRSDPEFADFLAARMDLALDALDRQVLGPDYGRYQTVDGLRWPAWLITDGADATSEAVYGLSRYVRDGGGDRARATLRKLAEGVAALPLGDERQWPFGAIMPWAQSRSVWHAWGDQMAGALAEASSALGDDAFVDVAVGEVGRFTPHLLAQGGHDNGWLPAPLELAQIAYGADATLQNLARTARVARRPAFRDLAGIAAAWYFGANRSGVQMYDPATGRTFDGLEGDGRVNRNSGAESTIHGLLSMMVLDADPRIAERAQLSHRGAHVTWKLYEAETGTLTGAAEVVKPGEAWTGESLWGGGAHVMLGPGGSVSIPVTLPVADRYLVMPVFHHQIAPEGSVGTTHRLGRRFAGTQSHAGAGDQGVTPWPGFLDIGPGSLTGPLVAGATTSTATYFGDGRHAGLDSILVQPQVEWLTLTGEGGAQTLLRSFGTTTQTRTIRLADSGRPVARAYDTSGRLVHVSRGRGGRVQAPVAPGGFTVVTAWK